MNSNKIIETLKILYQLGIIKDFEIKDDYIMIFLKYNKGRTIFKKLKVISLPSKRVYVDLIKLAKLKDKSGGSFYILSTGKGLRTDFECLLLKMGGEVLLKVEL
jgi:ribosomal protein S8